VSGHFPVAQPPSGLEAWQRSHLWWNWYFAIVAAGTLLLAFQPRAVVVILAMVAWYLLLGRRVLWQPLPARCSVLYLAVATALLAVAVVFSSGSSFALFALSPQAHMSLRFRYAVAATTVMNLVPAAVLVARGRDAMPALTLGAMAIVLSTVIGYSIDRLIDQSMQLAQSRAEVARLSQEAERRRLGADLHDTIAQGLSSILMLVQAADAALDRDRAEARRHLDLAARTARESLHEVRAVLDALLPTEQDLPEALRRLTTRFTEETGVIATLAVEGKPRPLPVATEVVLLRAAQESLSNVRRHASARSVAMMLGYSPREVRLHVTDDGQGFDISRTVGGYGLHAMRSRVTQAGGEVEVEPTPDGTSIRVAVPA
jgi:signal transduction histidine kinase